MKTNVVKLNYLWWGVCIGGRHYTGDITYNKEKVELVRNLSRKEAKEMAEESGRLWIRRQTSTNQFNDYEQMIRAAKRWCEKNVPAPWVCFLYDEINPNEIVAASPDIPKRPIRSLNKFSKAWWKTTERRREELWDEGYKAWWAGLALIGITER